MKPKVLIRHHFNSIKPIGDSLNQPNFKGPSRVNQIVTFLTFLSLFLAPEGSHNPAVPYLNWVLTLRGPLNPDLTYPNLK